MSPSPAALDVWSHTRVEAEGRHDSLAVVPELEEPLYRSPWPVDAGTSITLEV